MLPLMFNLSLVFYPKNGWSKFTTVSWLHAESHLCPKDPKSGRSLSRLVEHLRLCEPHGLVWLSGNHWKPWEKWGNLLHPVVKMKRW